MRQFTRAAIVAAAVILVVFGGWSVLNKNFDSRAAFAMAIEQVRGIQTFTFVTTTKVPGQDMTITMKTYVDHAGRMRQEIDVPARAVNIIDYKQGRILSLVEDLKLAQVIDISGLPENQVPKDIVGEFTKIDPGHTNYLRDEEHNGVATHLYQLDNGPISGFVWIDAETKLPVQMDISMSAGDGRTIPKVVLDQFDWDVQLDESMFSMQIPEGYQTKRVDMSNPSEADLILLLRLWAALSQEPFPEGMGPVNLSMTSQLLHDPSLTPMENHKRLVERIGNLLGEDAFAPENMMQAMTKLGETVGRGTMFIVKLEQTGWHWVGGGVSAGEADKPLCWWKDDDTGKYRIVYGDFTVRDIEPEDLPGTP